MPGSGAGGFTEGPSRAIDPRTKEELRLDQESQFLSAREALMTRELVKETREHMKETVRISAGLAVFSLCYDLHRDRTDGREPPDPKKAAKEAREAADAFVREFFPGV